MEQMLSKGAHEARAIQAMLFDLDGTLINSVDVLMDFLLRWGSLYGGSVDRDDFLRVNGMSVPQALRTLVGEGKIKKRSLLQMLVRYGSLKRELKQQIQLYPHVLECIHRWHGQVPLAIVTSGPRKHAEHFLHQFDLLSHFDCLVTRNDVKNKKPHPEPFLKAARLLNVEPGSCLVVEDSPNGVQAANQAGMVVGVVLHTTPRESFIDLSEPRFFLENLAELDRSRLGSERLIL